jgi:chromosome segregation ATPase
MSQPPSPLSSATPAEIERLREDLSAKILLIQDIRKELILAQITVLELTDTILRKDTEKTDAVALLAEAEKLLEQKIDAIFELDRVLNLKIADLQRNLAGETAEKHARDRIIQDLVEKLDTANREIGAAHTLAGNYARDLAHTQEQLQDTTTKLAEATTALAATREELAITTAARTALEHELAGMRATLSWRLTAPFRKLRHLFS